MSRNMEIATEIKRQLGRQFPMMTGAKQFTTTEGGLCFKLPGGKHMTIVLNGLDLYDISLFRTGHFRKGEWVDNNQLDVKSDVYAEDMHNIFTEMTGLYTCL